MKMDMCFGLRVQHTKDVWIAPNFEIKEEWMKSHKWTRDISEAEKFISEQGAKDYAEKHGLLGCDVVIVPAINNPTSPVGGTPMAVAA